VFVSVPVSRFRQLVHGEAVGAYHRLLGEVCPEFAQRLEGATQLEAVHGFGGHPGFIKRSSGPGWALVGDAGYFKDPATAHGITDALRDAELLARAVIAGTSAAMAGYESTRLDLSRRLFAITDEIVSFEHDEIALLALHREFSREMSREVRFLDALDQVESLAS
jgi:2-polyprenyl-6-methoxyphenol hydroxylase-like FAD-dependent oxidoreductase